MKTITYNPETHVLVPIEPTRDMVIAGTHQRFRDSYDAEEDCYRAMIAAAPQPEPNHNWCVGCSPDNCSGCGTTPKPDRRAELEAGLDKADCINSRLLAEKATLELEVARLRSVMEDVIKAHGYSGGTPIEVLSTPFTPTALPELIEKVEKMTIERCAEKLLSIGALGDGDFLAAIRALPTGQIKLDELL